MLHNLDEKSTNLYDIKLAEYSQPVCVDNLDVDTQFANEYHSDLIFAEEKKQLDVDDTMVANDNEQYSSPNDAAAGKGQGGQIQESKEYVEINFKFNYDGEDDTPVKLDLGVDGNGVNQNAGNALKQSAASKVDIYDSDSIIFIEPMFMVDTKKFQNYTIKLSLEKFIEKQRNMCR